MIPEERLDEFLRFVYEERLFARLGNWGTPTRLRFYLEGLFRGIDLQSKRALDVGAGTGIFSIFMSLLGAESVHALEPEAAGSQSTMRERCMRMMQRLGLTNILFEKKTFQEALPLLKPFDIVLLHNSINHLDEQACTRLHREPRAKLSYLDIFQSLHGITKPGGVLIVADCTCFNIFDCLGMKSPLCPTINWRIHQTPEVWEAFARQARFSLQELRWTTPGHLGTIGRSLLSNRAAAYFLLSHYTLFLRKLCLGDPQ